MEELMIPLSIEQAIEISKVLCKAPEERLTMLLSVYEAAGIQISGLEELEEWKAVKDQSYLIDIQEFLSELETQFPADEKGNISLLPEQFRDVCSKARLKDICCKRILHRHGYLKTHREGNKLNYTASVWKDGKAQRMVVVNKNPIYKEEPEC